MTRGVSSYDEGIPLLQCQATTSTFTEEDANVTNIDCSSSSSNQFASSGQASDVQTVLNQMKTCMGTGTLALSYACKEGGWLLYAFGMIAIAAWNLFCVHRLCLCLHYIPPYKLHVATCLDPEADTSPGCQTRTDREQIADAPPQGTSTLGRVAWFAFGRAGLEALDFMMIVLLLGIIISYQAASLNFLADTPFSMGPMLDVILTASTMCFIALVPDMGYLSHVSAVGLTVLLGTFLVITWFGFVSLKHHSSQDFAIPWYPASLSGLSSWFGIIVFSSGVVPLTYNFRESMADPSHIVPATRLALSLVALLYLVMGLGLLALFPDLTGDVLHELPNGILPIVARIAMISVVVMTAPLLVVPCGELVEGKWGIQSRLLSRATISFLCAAIALLWPSFVQVLSVVGSGCVGTVSFILPPLLHWKLSGKQNLNPLESGRSKSYSRCVDMVMLVLGVTATSLATTFSVIKTT